MSRRNARQNRLGLGIIGLMFIGAGAAALARGLDLAPEQLGPAHSAIIDHHTRNFAADNTWFWPALAVTNLVLALIALRWILAQTRTKATRTIHLEPDQSAGTTTLSPRVLTDAIQEDLGSGPHLRRARATLSPTGSHPRLALTVTLQPNADPAAAKHHLHHAQTRLRQATDTQHLPTTIYIRTTH